jgi:SNF2 family DNA or RNA helicase
MTGQSAKFHDVRQRLRTLESEGHRALIFSQFTDEKHGVRAIASRLHSLRPLLYTGDLSSHEKNATMRKFKENPEHKVLVLSLRAGGQGLNLQDASYVFHFDRWWNPAVERQAEDRAHRLGQTFPVHVYRYILEGTIEERIDHVLREKQLLFDELVDGVSIDLKSALTSEELFGLFGLKPPKPAKTPRHGKSF